MHLRRAFADVLPNDIRAPEASKPAEELLRLNQLFNIESKLEGLSPDQKKKERLIREKPLLETFGSWAEISCPICRGVLFLNILNIWMIICPKILW